MLRFVVVCVVGALLMGGCTDEGPTDGAKSTPEPTRSSSAVDETAPPSPSVRRLVVPRPVAGEVARVTYDEGRTEGRIERRARKGRYMVQSSCVGTRPGAAITYEVRSAEPGRSSEPPVSRAEITCDGGLSQNSGIGLKGRVQLDLVDVDEGVTQAYVVIVPASET